MQGQGERRVRNLGRSLWGMGGSRAIVCMPDHRIAPSFYNVDKKPSRQYHHTSLHPRLHTTPTSLIVSHATASSRSEARCMLLRNGGPSPQASLSDFFTARSLISQKGRIGTRAVPTNAKPPSPRIFPPHSSTISADYCNLNSPELSPAALDLPLELYFYMNDC